MRWRSSIARGWTSFHYVLRPLRLHPEGACRRTCDDKRSKDEDGPCGATSTRTMRWSEWRELSCSREARYQARGVAAFDGGEVGGGQAHLADHLDLVEREIGIIRAEGDLRGRHELHQRGHRGRARRVRGVVVQAAELGEDAVRSERLVLAGVRGRARVERLDPAGEHRDGAA